MYILKKNTRENNPIPDYRFSKNFPLLSHLTKNDDRIEKPHARARNIPARRRPNTKRAPRLYAIPRKLVEASRGQKRKIHPPCSEHQGAAARGVSLERGARKTGLSPGVEISIAFWNFSPPPPLCIFCFFVSLSFLGDFDAFFLI